MGSRRFVGGNGRRSEFERIIEGKRGRCTKSKGYGNYLISALVRATEMGVCLNTNSRPKEPCS
jgi:hypothetical protein